jgi:hypothetical protein
VKSSKVPTYASYLCIEGPASPLLSRNQKREYALEVVLRAAAALGIRTLLERMICATGADVTITILSNARIELKCQ